jgi:hypothetical protein
VKAAVGPISLTWGIGRRRQYLSVWSAPDTEMIEAFKVIYILTALWMWRVSSNSLNTKCPTGEYAKIPTGTCVKCEKGKYNPTIGASACMSCPAGTKSYILGASSPSCSDCPPGTYAQEGSSSCTACPAGKTSAYESSSCTDCPAGTYAFRGQPTCELCPYGTYSAAGAIACITCSTGRFSSPGASACEACSSRQLLISYNSGLCSSPQRHCSTRRNEFVAKLLQLCKGPQRTPKICPSNYNNSCTVDYENPTRVTTPSPTRVPTPSPTRVPTPSPTVYPTMCVDHMCYNDFAIFVRNQP